MVFLQDIGTYDGALLGRQWCLGPPAGQERQGEKKMKEICQIKMDSKPLKSLLSIQEPTVRTGVGHHSFGSTGAAHQNMAMNCVLYQDQE